MTVDQEIAALSRMTTKQLKRKFAELTGDATSANNRPWLIKRLAWRLQAMGHGGPSDRALARSEELANDAGLRFLLAPGMSPCPTGCVLPIGTVSPAPSGERMSPGRGVAARALMPPSPPAA
jgi:hypothetical protein